MWYVCSFKGGVSVVSSLLITVFQGGTSVFDALINQKRCFGFWCIDKVKAVLLCSSNVVLLFLVC